MDIYDGTNVFVFKYPNELKEFLKSLEKDSYRIVGHNIIQHDYPLLSKLWNINLDPIKIIDTLILSQLLDMRIEGGHSQEAWGDRLGFQKKGVDITDFSESTPELLARCESDVRLNYLIYQVLMDKLERKEFERAIDVEHRIGFICLGMHLDGFKFAYHKAIDLLNDINTRLNEIDEYIREAFKPRLKCIREINPRSTKYGTINKSDFRWYKGNDYSIFQVDAPFSLCESVEFNPGSPSQVVERLNEAGWKPFNKTKGHIEAEKTGDQEKLDHYKVYGWKVDEDNLTTLPESAPKACSYLVERIMLSARRSMLESWISLYHPKTGTINGHFHGMGTWTHRMRHTDPNMGNIATKKSIKYKTKHLYDLALKYGAKMRELWEVEKDEWLVGCDGDQIQLRILAHYLEDERLIKALVSGDKELGTDVHTLHMSALGEYCKTRDQSKTFIYAYLLGAQADRVASILFCPKKEAKQALINFTEYYPGLKTLRTDIIARDAKRGYFQGLDGRFIVCQSEHHMLAGYLQSGEALIMKYANVLWRAEAKKLGLRFVQRNFVHDEYQTSLKGSEEEARKLGQIQSNAITDAANNLGLKCPMKGQFKIGKNWYETH